MTNNANKGDNTFMKRTWSVRNEDQEEEVFVHIPRQCKREEFQNCYKTRSSSPLLGHAQDHKQPTKLTFWGCLIILLYKAKVMEEIEGLNTILYYLTYWLQRLSTSQEDTLQLSTPTGLSKSNWFHLSHYSNEQKRTAKLICPLWHSITLNGTIVDIDIVSRAFHCMITTVVVTQKIH